MNLFTSVSRSSLKKFLSKMEVAGIYVLLQHKHGVGGTDNTRNVVVAYRIKHQAISGVNMWLCDVMLQKEGRNTSKETTLATIKKAQWGIKLQ